MRPFIFTVAVLLAACVPPPKYVPPADPFDKGNPAFQTIRPTIRSMVVKGCDSTKVYTPTSEEKAALEVLKNLINEGHCPSMYLGAALLGCTANSYKESGGYNGKLKKFYQKEAREKNLSKAELDAKYDQLRVRAGRLLVTAAKFGYPKAQEAFIRANKPLPSVTFKTKPQQAAQKDYAEQAQRYNENQQAWANAITSAAEGIAAGARRANSAVVPSTPQLPGNNVMVVTKCSFDSDCIFPEKCMKGAYDIQGACAQPVDDLGVPAFTFDSLKAAECNFDTDCSVGFRCIKLKGSLNGICMK